MPRVASLFRGFFNTSREHDQITSRRSGTGPTFLTRCQSVVRTQFTKALQAPTVGSAHRTACQSIEDVKTISDRGFYRAG